MRAQAAPAVPGPGRPEAPGAAPALALLVEHLDALAEPLGWLRGQLDQVERWGHTLAAALSEGRRLLTAGNGGSAAHAQHLSAELVGRFRLPRRPLSAIALHADTSAFTAVANDYGFEEVLARQVGAHGRPGDILLAFSTSGRSPNVLRAVERAAALGLVTWSLTGPQPNALAACCDEAVTVPAARTATVQELHQVVIHLLCTVVDTDLAGGSEEPARLPGLEVPGGDGAAWEGLR